MSYIGVKDNISTDEERIAGDAILQANIDNEGLARANGDLQNSNNLLNAVADLENQIGEKLSISNSVYMENYTKYCVDNRDSLHDIINSITNQASVVNISQGSFNEGPPLIIDKQNIALIGQASTPAIVEFGFPVSTANTADRVRMRYLSFDNVFTASSSRSVYTHITFNENVFITAPNLPSYMSFINCEFASSKTINVASNFNSVCYFINCNFSGATINLQHTNSASVLVIFSNCAGFNQSFPPTGTYAGINTLVSGYIQNTITKTILATTGSGNAGDVLKSGGQFGVDYWEAESGGGGSSSGVCLESINVYCKGQTLITKYGDSITIPNVSAVQELNQVGAELTGSVVQYRPPAGCKLVIYTFQTHLSGRATDVFTARDAQFEVYFNSTEIPLARMFISNNRFSFGYIDFSVCIQIGGTNDISNGSLSSWNNLNTFTWRGKHQGEVGTFPIHTKFGYFENGTSQPFSPPKIKIEAFS